jgi:uncharacterized repeat protein (TIGR02543 family)
MKKAIFGIIAILAVFAMVGCGGGSGPNPEPEGPVTYTVTFDKNTTDSGSTAPSPATKTVTAPATNVGSLPATEPTRSGYIFDGYNTEADGTGTAFTSTTTVTASITVYAKWKAGYKVTFDKNAADALDGNKTSVDLELAAGETPGTTAKTVGSTNMPTAPTRPAFEFKGWNLLESPEEGEEDDTAFDGDTDVTDSITVYAQWEFVGGTPELISGTSFGTVISISSPLFEPDTENGNADVDLKTGVYSLEGGGQLNFLFPTSVGTSAQDANDYDYFIINVELLSQSGSTSGITLKQYESATDYVVYAGQNKYPWLSNNDGKRMLLYPSGAGDTGGIGFNAGSTSDAKFKVTSIVFYKAPRYKVIFDVNDDGKSTPLFQPDGTTQHPGQIEDIWGYDLNQNGNGIGAANWPKDPDRTAESPTPYYFLGWFNAATGGTMYAAATPIKENMTLYAQWTDVEPDKVEMITVNNGSALPVYRFTLADQWGGNDDDDKAVSKITYTIWVDAGVTDSVGNRMHIVGNFTSFTSGVSIVSSWDAVRLLNIEGSSNVSAILAQGKNKDGNNGTKGEWVTFEWLIGPTYGKDASADPLPAVNPGTPKYNAGYTATNYPAANAAEVYLGLGLSSNAGNVSYYIKDVALILADGSKVENDDIATDISGTALGAYYFTSNGGNTVVRELKYSPGN